MASQHPLRQALLLAAAVFLPLSGISPALAQTARPASANVPGQAWLLQAFSLNEAGSLAPPPGAPTAIAQSLATWDLLRRPPKSFMQSPALSLQAHFIENHPDWPGVTAIRRRAEAQAADIRTPDADARAFFTRIEPESAAGQARLALLSTGSRANELARNAWGRTGLSPEQETALLARFAGTFRAQDHARRADALIWAGQTTAASRIVQWLDADTRALAEARIALRTNAANGDSLAAALPSRLRRDPGLVHDRSIWLERRGRLADAEQLLANGEFDAGKVTAPETWLERRLALGRAAMRRGAHDTAWRLLANHRSFDKSVDTAALPLSVRVDLSDTEWLAGWIALRRLNRPAEAVNHFNRFRAAVNTPISTSRGEYWLGRAEKARDNRKAATAAFERAASYFDYFYGQLAAEELGRAPQLPVDMTKPEISSAARQAFHQSSLVQALDLLAAIDHRQHETRFVRALANTADTPEKARLSAEYGLTIDRPDLGVWTWKATRDQQEFSGIQLAYPRLPAAGIATIPARDRVLSHAIARQESSFDRTALSPAGARGLMQLMPATARDVARRLGVSYDVDRLFSDPAYNLRMGGYYIGMRRDSFSSAMMAIAAYNAGAGNVRKWLAMNGDPRTTTDPIDWVEMIPFSETRNYVQRVIENAVVYSLLDPEQPGANPRASGWLRGG